MKQKCLLLFSACIYFTASLGQTYQQSGMIPQVLFKQKLNSYWNASIALNSEMLLTETEANGQTFGREVLNYNLQAVASYDYAPEIKFDFGLLLRRSDPFEDIQSYEIRPWQQVTYQFYQGKYRLRNRLRMEERAFVQEDEKGELDWRLRYRFSVDFPLAGTRLDPNEFYLNSSSEALIQLDRPEALRYWENRSYLGIGYLFRKKNRLEIGPELRMRRRTENLSSQIVFWRLVWVIPINLKKPSVKEKVLGDN